MSTRSNESSAATWDTFIEPVRKEVPPASPTTARRARRPSGRS